MFDPAFLLTAFVVVIAPGAGVLYTVAIGLGRGRVASIWAAAGCTLGILPHLLAATLGLAAILHTSALAFHAMKLVGVLYLLYLAWGALQAGGALDVAPDRATEPGPRTALRGMLLNALNPKLSLFFLALLPPFLSGTPGTATAEMLSLGAMFMAMTFAVFCLYGSLAASARERVLQSPRLLTWLGRGIAALFAALAARLAMERA
ncbi:LysE family translocator [Palleronia abyssalis]|uniref:Homoserine/homoserine lactone efflux protein n=1 Tax=Palleronia abyssalis TaxID=1501240 RepID=A0A2R8BYJ6_9RHOB|nr:LysE family translocator [Palleronia abyssalis]SPJ25202.1 Homoserine/homoserine lactone efflux protein [Palleronia abyssalis]